GDAIARCEFFERSSRRGPSPASSKQCLSISNESTRSQQPMRTTQAHFNSPSPAYQPAKISQVCNLLHSYLTQITHPIQSSRLFSNSFQSRPGLPSDITNLHHRLAEARGK